MRAYAPYRAVIDSSFKVVPLPSSVFQHAPYCGGDSVELLHFGLKLVAAVAGQFVEPGFAVELAHLPFGSQPALDLHSLERGIERPFFDLQYVVGDLLDGLGDAVSVHGSARKRF